MALSPPGRHGGRAHHRRWTSLCQGILCNLPPVTLESVAVGGYDDDILGNTTLIDDPGSGLDAVSKRIIEQLQQDGRRSYAAIARAVGLSEAATRQRVQRLIDERVVQIAAVTDAAAIGFHRMALLGIKVEGDIRRVAEELTALPEAEYVVICAGQFDVLVELLCVDDEHLLQVIDESVRTIAGVTSTETFVYLKVAKETYQWGTR
ncbi:MAG: Lrp/AsnC family transcriptional regulator [Acidimicrobiales bacterium]|nr:Lrp/AsnC family transcriptional regulator [Acidimicrobiales bacterium]